MKTIDVTLQHLTNIVATCIVIHNMCAISNNKFNRE